MDTTKNDPKPYVDPDEVLFFMREIVETGREYMQNGPARLGLDDYRSEYPDVAMAIAVAFLYQAVKKAEATRRVEIKL